MSYESTAEPIKVGYLMDFKLPDLYPQEMKEDLSNPFDLVFGQALEDGLIDRPIQIVYKEVEGLPKGSVKAVIDAFGELVDEGCLACLARTSPTIACRPARRSKSGSRYQRSA
jgi:branched-chain amino acid transport system substrate-binding protein